jgi:hemerythrin-like domain-containing protein
MTATEILVDEHRLIKKVLDWGEEEIGAGVHEKYHRLAEEL